MRRSVWSGISRSWGSAALAGLLLLLPAAGRAATVESNIGATAGAGTLFTSQVRKAYGFTTPATVFQLSRVALRLNNTSATAEPKVAVSLFSETGGKPGTLVASLGQVTLLPGATDAQYSFFPAGVVALEPATNYWIVVSADAGARWGGTSTFPAMTFGFLSSGYLYSSDTGANWIGSGTQNFLAVDAAPLPAAARAWGGTFTLGTGINGPNGWRKAMGFTTALRTTSLRLVRVVVDNDSEEPGTVTLALHADDAGNPAASPAVTLGQFKVPGLTQDYFGEVVPANPVSLAPGTTYWLVMTGSEQMFNWNTVNPPALPTMSEGFTLVAYRVDGGGGWGPSSTYNTVSLDLTEPSLVSNLSSTAGGQGAAISGTYQWAYSFTTGPQQYLLAQAVLRLRLTNPAEAGTADAELHDDSAGNPGALRAALGTASVAAGASDGNYLIKPASAPRLAANTTFWLLVKGTNTNWVTGNPETAPTASLDITKVGYKYSSDSGATWNVQNVNFPRFDLQGYPVHSLTSLSRGADDGWVLETTESSGKGGTLDYKTTALRVGDDLLDRQYRSVLSFDTAMLPDNAVVTAGTLKVKKQAVAGKDPFLTHGKLVAALRKPYLGTKAALEAADFQAAPSLASAALFGATASGGWHSATLVSGARTLVNRTGLTQMRLGFQKDDNDDRGNDYAILYSGSAAGANRPSLKLEFYAP